MSLADHLEPIADPGFYPTVKPESARRQLHMSLGLVAILAAVALLVGMTAGFGNIRRAAASGMAAPAALVVQAPDMVHVHDAAASNLTVNRGG